MSETLNKTLTEDVKDKVVSRVQRFTETEVEPYNYVEDLVDETIAVKDIVSGAVKEQVGKATDNEVLELKGKLQRLEADDSFPTTLVCTVAVVAISAITIGWLFSKKRD